jgi:hypothetical protein
MKKPVQLELFGDGARSVAASKPRVKPPKLDEAHLQKRLDDARQRLRALVIFQMMTWIPEEKRKGLPEAERWARQNVRMLHGVLERFCAKQQPGRNP